MYALFVNASARMLLRVVTGIALVALFNFIESWLNGDTPAESRGRVLAVYMFVNLISLAVAQQFIRLEGAV